MSEELREFDRSKWSVPGFGPEVTAEEGRRGELCESYIRSARWSEGTSANIRDLVAMNVRGAWPVAYTQGFKDGAATIERLEGEVERLRGVVRAVQWAYPPADAVVGNWNLAARCPSCFVEWTPAEVHAADCSLGAALEEGK